MSKLSIHSQDDEGMSLLVSAVLFLGTTSTALLYLRKRIETNHQKPYPPPTIVVRTSENDTTRSNDEQQDTGMNDEDGENDDNDDKFNMEWYRLRRMEDRMSFREVNSCQHDHQLPYSNHHHQQQQQQPPPVNITVSSTITTPSRDHSKIYSSSMNSTDNDVFDHNHRSGRRRSSELVVQNNWNHFEGYHSDDDTSPQTLPLVTTASVQQQQQQQQQQDRRNAQHVDEIHPMIKSSNIFREISIGSDHAGEEVLSKLLEGEDLPDQELYCAYPRSNRNNEPHQKFTSPSITPPPFRSSASSTDDDVSIQPPPPPQHPQQQHQQQQAHSVSLVKSTTGITRPEPRIANSSISHIPSHIRRARSVPDPTFENNNETLDSQTVTNNYIASNRTARAKYNASIMPNKLILIRHGQSLGNVDEKLYATTPDNAMPLTELGWEQAKAAGQQLKQLLTSSSVSNMSIVDCNSNHSNKYRDASAGTAATTTTTSVHFIVSPYVRTVETFHGIVAAWCDPSEFDYIDNYEQRLHAWYSRLMEHGLTWAEDPRIREQDFGNYQEPKMIQQAKRDRHMFGAFYYRFPLGESASDVFDRVSTFLDSLWRSFDTNNSRNYVLVTHGISIRVILARYFRYTIDQFHQLANPRNCEMVVLQHDGAGRLVLGGRYELESKKKSVDVDHCNTNTDPRLTSNAVEYTFHPRLRVLPQKYAHKAKVRMKYGD